MHIASPVYMIYLRWIYWTRDSNNEASQIAMFSVTVINKNHRKEGLTNYKFAEELYDPPPRPPLKLLNRICIDLKNDPNGSEKTDFR